MKNLAMTRTQATDELMRRGFRPADMRPYWWRGAYTITFEQLCREQGLLIAE